MDHRDTQHQADRTLQLMLQLQEELPSDNSTVREAECHLWLATARTPINLDLEEEYHQELLTDQDDPGHEQEEFHNRSLVPARHHLLQ